MKQMTENERRIQIKKEPELNTPVPFFVLFSAF